MPSVFQILEGAMSQGLIDDVGSHKFSYLYTPYVRNFRNVNGSLVVRNGYRAVYEGSTQTKIQCMASVNDTLYAVFNNELYSIDVDAGTATQESSTTSLPSSDISCVSYRDVIILFTGSGFPFVYDSDADTWSQLTSSNIATGANPSFGEVYANFVFAAAGPDLYISRGITKANPEYAYDWVGTGSEILSLKSDIVSLKATLSRLFVFTKKTIEYFDEGTLSSIGSVTTSFTKEISKDNVPVSNDAVVVAEDRIFMLTTDRNIKEVNRAGVDDLQVANISDQKGRSIRKFLRSLHADQSGCKGIYNQENGIVMWNVRGADSSINNLRLIYDLNSDSFWVDDNIYFGCYTYHNNILYAGGYATDFIFEDNTGHDDDGGPIYAEIHSTRVNLQRPDILKIWKQFFISGEHNFLSSISIDLYVDNEVAVGPLVINGDADVVGGIGSEAIGEESIGEGGDEIMNQRFEYLSDKGTLRAKGTDIQARIVCNSVGGETIISDIGFGYQPTTQIKRNKKLYISS